MTVPVFFKIMEEKATAVDWKGSELPETDLFVKPSHGRGDRMPLAGFAWVQGSIGATMARF
ncbi:MAG: hypothetical protein ABS69_04020 [Nitrosomonadales bacterium SCN 54-20]|nr:MAG: hypothetical protein ABS69_04020 [Nitrosomonadales bacterium SCN 54-20]